jgi:hypothetical protein
MYIPNPSGSEVKKYLDKWDSLENYVLQERSLKKLFTKTYPKNKSMDDILIKVCSLNDFYSTNIFSPVLVSKHIAELDVDKRLKEGDLSLVNDIAEVEVSKDKTINFYSFATKYCSHHRPLIYPIYDSYVEKVLMYFRRQDNFYEFLKKDLKIYPKYREILIEFKNYYGLKNYNLKQIDKYLWQLGKEYFPREY